jgi:hypothetical protein
VILGKRDHIRVGAAEVRGQTHPGHTDWSVQLCGDARPGSRLGLAVVPLAASPSSWAILQRLVTRWVNIYRMDDYIGTYIAPADSRVPLDQQFPINRPIGAGGHTRYWHQPPTFALKELEGSLPGC